MPKNYNRRIAKLSKRLPLVAEMSPKPHVERVVVTKYIATMYCYLKSKIPIPFNPIQEVW